MGKDDLKHLTVFAFLKVVLQKQHCTNTFIAITQNEYTILASYSM